MISLVLSSDPQGFAKIQLSHRLYLPRKFIISAMNPSVNRDLHMNGSPLARRQASASHSLAARIFKALALLVMLAILIPSAAEAKRPKPPTETPDPVPAGMQKILEVDALTIKVAIGTEGNTAQFGRRGHARGDESLPNVRLLGAFPPNHRRLHPKQAGPGVVSRHAQRVCRGCRIRSLTFNPGRFVRRRASEANANYKKQQKWNRASHGGGGTV
jgi:hypothetical protein